MEEKKKIAGELQEKQREIQQLYNSLHKLNSEKEGLFRTKEQVEKKVLVLVQELKEAKGKRDALTKQVKDSKERRATLNSGITAKIEEIKRLDEEKKAILRKNRIKEDPIRLKSQIEHLELTIETEGMSFEAEQKVMKRIKELKKQYGELKILGDVFDKIHKAEKELRMLRDKANDSHRKVQDKAKNSQEEHELLVKDATELRQLREERETLYQKCIEAKQRFNEANEQLKSKLTELAALKEKADEYFMGKAELEKKRAFDSLKEKVKLVEEKIRRGEKLTTDDLIVMQGVN